VSLTWWTVTSLGLASNSPTAARYLARHGELEHLEPSTPGLGGGRARQMAAEPAQLSGTPGEAVEVPGGALRDPDAVRLLHGMGL
jgi:hypothetical protein